MVILAVDARTGALIWWGDAGEGGGTLRASLGRAMAKGATQVHVHLLAATAAARRDALDDIARR